MCERCSSRRNELFLENGFGFDLSTPEEVEVVFASSLDRALDFQAFFREQIGHMSSWLQALPEWVEDDRLDSLAGTARSSFSLAIASAAEEVGAQGFTRAEVLCRLMLEPMVLYAVARRSLPAWSSDDDVLDEARRMASLGVSSGERAAEIRVRDSLARTLAGASRLGSESARHLRARRLRLRAVTASSVVRPRALVRRRGSGRRLRRHRTSPSRGSPGRDSDDEPGAPGERGGAL
jgi:hypothetical protein